MRLDAKKLFRTGIFVLLLGGAGLLVMHQTRGVIRGPVLRIDEPLDGSSSPDSVITLSGSTEHLARLLVNNDDTPARSDGTFSTILLISPGYNVITVDVYDRFGKHTQKRLHIYGDFEEYSLIPESEEEVLESLITDEETL